MMIRVDQGGSGNAALDLWTHQRGVTLDFSRPGKPTDSAFIEKGLTARSATKRSSSSIDQWRTARPERNRP
jgi:transposase InsO family protein